MKAALLVLVIVLAACAAALARQPTDFTPVPVAAQRTEIELIEDVEVPLSSGASRVLTRGWRWELVGTTPEGRVYQRTNGIFTLEGAQAYLVLAGERLLGFYLLAEKAFSPTTPIALRFQ